MAANVILSSPGPGGHDGVMDRLDATLRGADGLVPEPGPERAVYCNRTVNLRTIRAIGYDLDYTLVHYRPSEWEGAAFGRAQELLADRGWPVDHFVFEPQAFTQGLVFDLELGNIVKATRFGYVIRAQHGTRPLAFEETRRRLHGHGRGSRRGPVPVHEHDVLAVPGQPVRPARRPG